MIDFIIRKITNNYNKMLLLSIFINGNTLKQKGSIEINCHPSLANDKYLRDKIEHISEYIRETYTKEGLI